MLFTFFAIIFYTLLYFIMADFSKGIFGAATHIFEPLNHLANASCIEGMATSWFKTIHAPHNHFPSPAVRPFDAEVIMDLKFSCKEVSYLMRDCVFLEMLAILLDKLKVQIHNASLHWLDISCCPALLEKFDTLKWDVDIQFRCSDGKSFFNIIFGKRHYLRGDKLW
jgi:hypothetical protein